MTILEQQGWTPLAIEIANAARAGPNGVLGNNAVVTDADRWNHVAEIARAFVEREATPTTKEQTQ